MSINNLIYFLCFLLVLCCIYSYSFDGDTLTGTVIHGKGIEHKDGFPTANISLCKVPKDWYTEQRMYICNSNFGVGILWNLLDATDKAMVYFIDLPHDTNLYGKYITLRNVNPVRFQRESNFIKYICEKYCEKCKSK